MKIIEHLSDQIADEIECAEEYAKCALAKKEDYPQLAETYYRIATEKLNHMGLLHAQVVAIIDAYKKQKGEPPEAMKLLYEILHRKHIEHADAQEEQIHLESMGYDIVYIIDWQPDLYKQYCKKIKEKYEDDEE